MMNFLKQHWPFVIMLALVVFLCISFITYAPQDTGAGIVLVAIMSKDLKVWDYWQMGVFSFAGALVGMIFGCLIKVVKNQLEELI